MKYNVVYRLVSNPAKIKKKTLSLYVAEWLTEAKISRDNPFKARYLFCANIGNPRQPRCKTQELPSQELDYTGS